MRVRGPHGPCELRWLSLRVATGNKTENPSSRRRKPSCRYRRLRNQHGLRTPWHSGRAKRINVVDKNSYGFSPHFGRPVRLRALGRTEIQSTAPCKRPLFLVRHPLSTWPIASTRLARWAYTRWGTLFFPPVALLGSADTSPVPAVVLPYRLQQALWSTCSLTCGSSQRPEIRYGVMYRLHGGKLACKNSGRVV